MGGRVVGVGKAGGEQPIDQLGGEESLGGPEQQRGRAQLMGASGMSMQSERRVHAELPQAPTIDIVGRNQSARAPTAENVRSWLATQVGAVRQAFVEERRVLTFDQYLEIFAKAPVQQTRSAAQYIRDAFDYFGTKSIRTPRGRQTRW